MISVNQMTNNNILKAVKSFERWHYQFDLKGVVTPIYAKEWINRHNQRKRYFFDPLVYLGFFRGKRVLDVGCNAGFWSLCAIQAGCDFVLGLDAREMHIQQAELVFQCNEIERNRYHFIQTNIFNYDFEKTSKPFDIVLCLGFLYHVCKPMELLEKISQINTDLLIIDSTILNTPENHIELRQERLDDPRMAADYNLVFLPSPSAVRMMVETLGYRCRMLKPEFDDWEGCEDFFSGDRLVFICEKHTDLSNVFTNIVDRGLE